MALGIALRKAVCYGFKKNPAAAVSNDFNKSPAQSSVRVNDQTE